MQNCAIYQITFYKAVAIERIFSYQYFIEKLGDIMFLIYLLFYYFTFWWVKTLALRLF
jgi:hypothetical protein